MWSYGELNPGPLACHASALPTELQPRVMLRFPAATCSTLHGPRPAPPITCSAPSRLRPARSAAGRSSPELRAGGSPLPGHGGGPAGRRLPGLAGDAGHPGRAEPAAGRGQQCPLRRPALERRLCRPVPRADPAGRAAAEHPVGQRHRARALQRLRQLRRAAATDGRAARPWPGCWPSRTCRPAACAKPMRRPTEPAGAGAERRRDRPEGRSLPTVELRGIEPRTSCMPCKRSTN